MTAAEIIEELRPLGLESYKKVLRNHGIPEPFFGVKIEEMKKIQKRVKKDYRLALDLYKTGNYDAMYLAGLIADDARMTRDDLRAWLEMSNCDALRTSTLAWVAAESQHGWEIAREWVDSTDERAATAGWATLSSLVSIKDNSELDLDALRQLLERVGKTIHAQPNRVRSVMNGFVIAVGSYVEPLSELAVRTAKEIGEVKVDMGPPPAKCPSLPITSRKPGSAAASARSGRQRSAKTPSPSKPARSEG